MHLRYNLDCSWSGRAGLGFHATAARTDTGHVEPGQWELAVRLPVTEAVKQLDLTEAAFLVFRNAGWHFRALKDQRMSRQFPSAFLRQSLSVCNGTVTGE